MKAALLSAPCLVFLFELALVKRFVRPSRRAFEWFCAIGLIAACKFVGFGFFGGDGFNPELPVWVIVLWGWLESVVWVGLPVGVTALVLAAVSKRVRRVAFPSAVVVSSLFAGYGMWEGVRTPPLVEKEVVVSGLPSGFDGYRIAHLSDIHCSSAARRGKIAAIVERTNAAAPDLVAITGDLVDGFPPERADDLEPLKDLRAPDGVLVCTGNHEGYFDISAWEPYYRRWGLGLLRNRWTVIRRGSSALAVGGEDDRVFGGESPRLMEESAPAGGFRVLMRHQPLVHEYGGLPSGVGLQLSGHTHGGAMPVLSAFVAKANEGRVRGLYREGDTVVHVSPGTGQWAGFPLRFFNPPEITVLVLRRR